MISELKQSIENNDLTMINNVLTQYNVSSHIILGSIHYVKSAEALRLLLSRIFRWKETHMGFLLSDINSVPLMVGFLIESGMISDLSEEITRILNNGQVNDTNVRYLYGLLINGAKIINRSRFDDYIDLLYDVYYDNDLVDRIVALVNN